MTTFGMARAMPEDTIVVRSKQDVRLAPLRKRLGLTSTRAHDDTEKGEVGPEKDPEAEQEVDAEDDDEAVEEYDFSKESDDEEESDDGHDTAYYKNPDGAVTILDSDEDEKQEETHWKPSKYPWRKFEFNGFARSHWEQSYVDFIHYPMHGDWDSSEKYLAQRDEELFRYLKDYPIDKWLISRRLADHAVSEAKGRKRLRSMGLRIYPHQPHPFQPYLRTSGAPTAGAGPSGSQNLPMHQSPPQHQQGYLPREPMGTQLPYGMVGQYGPTQHHPHPVGMYQHVPGQMGPPPVPNRAYQGLGTHALSYGQPIAAGHGYPGNEGKGRMSNGPLSSHIANSKRIPPYEPRPRPTGGGSSSKHRHDMATNDVYPWNRQMEWEAAKRQSNWDDSIYDPALLQQMEAIRQRNKLTIANAEKAKKGNKQDDQDDGSPPADEQVASTSRPPVGLNKGSPMTDYYSFATEQDRRKALENVNCRTPEEVMDKYFRGIVSLDFCAKVKVCWNPHKKGITQQLTQVCFSVKDSVLTKEQIDRTPILDRTAALRVIDFAPNMLWKALLLRTTSEGGIINSEIRERMCENGNYLDKATITKRIGAALGQKQQQSTTRMTKKQLEARETGSSGKIDGYGPGEEEFMLGNTHDYDDYMNYFDRKITHRDAKFVRDAKAKKRKANTNANASSSDVEETGSKTVEPPKKRSMLKKTSATSPEAIQDSDATVEIVDGEAGDEEMIDVEDVVSVQSDTMLDEIED